MKRYLIATLFALGLVLVYHVFPINFFQLDLPQRVSNSLFSVFGQNHMPDRSIIILNSGNLSGPELKRKIDTLLTFNPKLVGINLCDIDDEASLLENTYSKNSTVVLATCSSTRETLSRQISDGNIVTHFKTDKPDYFEFKIADTDNELRARENELERINYYGSIEVYHHFDLTDLEDMLPEILENQIVLIGYCGEYVSAMDAYLGESQEELMQGYKNARITPMNRSYGSEDIGPDMYDIQISANIIRMINERNFITEINTTVRVGFILFCALLLVFLITIIRTKWLLLNLFIYFICYSLIIMGGTFLIAVAFSHNYYLEIPELSIVLTVMGIFTILYNLGLFKAKDTEAT